MMPIRGIFPGCWARAASGHAAAAPPRRVMNSRRLIQPPGLRTSLDQDETTTLAPWPITFNAAYRFRLSSAVVEDVLSALIRRRDGARVQSAMSAINRTDDAQDIRRFCPQPFAEILRSPYR